MKIHLCEKFPCPLQDKECFDILSNGFTSEYVSKLMPRAGLCNKCSGLGLGAEVAKHCKGLEMGCACKCIEKTV